MMNYIFHYNGSEAETQETERKWLDEGELTYHEHLVQQDGNRCTADLSCAENGTVCAFFEDGNELTVYLTELEAV